MTNVAFLGLGAMGLRMAKNLVKAGHHVVVYNRTAERAKELEAEGAKTASTPREAAERSDIVISIVTDNGASRAIWLDASTGAAAGLRPGTVAIESSTLTPEWARELASAVAKTGAEFLDAPVVGTRPHAEGAQLVFLVGGEASTFDKAQATLSCMGSKVVHVGPQACGMIMKLAVNALFGIQIAAFGEIIGMVRKSGIDGDKAITMLSGMAITSPAMARVAQLMAARTFSPNFPIDLVEKDFGYVVANAASVDASFEIAAAVRGVYARAKSEGHGGDDISGIAQLFD